MTTFLTPEELLADLRLVAEKRMADEGGIDHKYVRPGSEADGCKYVHRGVATEYVGGCIIGTYLHDVHEIPYRALAVNEGVVASALLENFNKVQKGSNLSLKVNVTARVANEVQSNQDQGVAWLAAVADVERRYQAGEIS